MDFLRNRKIPRLNRANNATKKASAYAEALFVRITFRSSHRK